VIPRAARQHSSCRDRETALLYGRIVPFSRRSNCRKWRTRMPFQPAKHWSSHRWPQQPRTRTERQSGVATFGWQWAPNGPRLVGMNQPCSSCLTGAQRGNERCGRTNFHAPSSRGEQPPRRGFKQFVSWSRPAGTVFETARPPV